MSADVRRDDPVAAATARATDGLSEADAGQVTDLVRQALAEIDPIVGPDDLAIEIEAALDVPVADRVAAARRFAAHRRAFSIGRRSWNLLQEFTSGKLPRAQGQDRARALLAEVDLALPATADQGTRYELGDYALEARYVLSGGQGPISLRGAKVTG